MDLPFPFRQNEIGSSVVHSSDVEDAYTKHDPLKSEIGAKEKTTQWQDIIWLRRCRIFKPRISENPGCRDTKSPENVKTHWWDSTEGHISLKWTSCLYWWSRDRDGRQWLTLVKNSCPQIKGIVSFHEDEPKSRYSGWNVPEYILKDLKRNASTGKLFIVSDEKGSLRCIIQNKAKRRAKSAKGRVLAFSTSENYLNISF